MKKIKSILIDDFSLLILLYEIALLVVASLISFLSRLITDVAVINTSNYLLLNFILLILWLIIISTLNYKSINFPKKNSYFEPKDIRIMISVTIGVSHGISSIFLYEINPTFFGLYIMITIGAVVTLFFENFNEYDKALNVLRKKVTYNKINKIKLIFEELENWKEIISYSIIYSTIALVAVLAIFWGLNISGTEDITLEFQIICSVSVLIIYSFILLEFYLWIYRPLHQKTKEIRDIILKS